jgi:predicted helicase
MPSQRDELRSIRTFTQLIKFLRDELEWPIESEDFEELTFDYTPEELGIDTASAAKIQEIKRLRPLSASQPWGIFFVKFEPKRLPVVALRRVLSRVVLKKRASANSADRSAWMADDLLFVSNYGEGDGRQISFAHFSTHGQKADLPTLKVLGWNSGDTPLRLDDVAETLTTKLAWPGDEKDTGRWRELWRSAFTLRHREVITTSQVLAVRLADLARDIRDRIRTVLAIETKKGPITRLMNAFREALIHDLSADDFADMYAQTIAYGLLSARVAHPKQDTADAVATHIPVTNPFLKELMETFLHLGGRKRRETGGDGIDFDELGVSDVVELLDAANMEAVVHDFGDRNRDEDPIIHFYELFLKEYDAKKRMQRGVFYTPQPVVSYIVRSVHELLQTEFGIEKGLASTVTWGEMAAKHSCLNVPEGVAEADPFVVILDPATGTATFLVEVIDVIYSTLAAKWEQQGLTDEQQRLAWNEYVPKHLLPRLHGYELLMAPYAIAHMKIGLKLHETGYEFHSNERARIYLTNALEPAGEDKKQREFEQWVPALAHEAEAVNVIKRKQHFTAVVGNPPYSGHSWNLTPELRRIVEPYRFLDGQRIKEKGALQLEKSIQDDYIKFMRNAEMHIAKSTVGLVGLVTSHGFLDNPFLRGMRCSVLSTYSNLFVLDLHGNALRYEKPPDGSPDKNVFEIQRTGIAISLFRRLWGGAGPHVYHAELWGSRDTVKYPWLTANSFSSTPVQQLAPKSPSYLLIPEDATHLKEYMRGRSIGEIMLVNSKGVVTGRDAFVIDFDEAVLLKRMRAFIDPVKSDKQLITEFDLNPSAWWNVHKARSNMPSKAKFGDFVRPLLYRPFDIRPCFYHPAVLMSPRRPVMEHMESGFHNMLLVTTRMTKGEPFRHVTVAKGLAEAILLSSKTSNNAIVFPLYLHPDGHRAGLDFGSTRQPNFTPEFIEEIRKSMGLQTVDGRGDFTTTVGVDDIFDYIVAILHSPAYRTRYAALLSRDFPRVPLTEKRNMAHALSLLGRRLVVLHLLESPLLDELITAYVGASMPEVEKVSYARHTIWLDKAQTRGFPGVPENVWNFHIGGYQVCEKWLKDRKGRILSKDDIAHYQKIVVALNETIRIMAEIDTVIDAHGGWPGAFAVTRN